MLEQDAKKEIYNLVKNNCPDNYNPLDYVQDIVRDLAIEKLNKCLQSCNCCEISKNKSKHYLRVKEMNLFLL